MPSEPIYRFGPFTLTPSRRELRRDGRPVALGARAFDLLQALVERRDRTVSKDELLDVVWPDVVVEEANLAVQVSALRKALGPAAIATIPGRGYRFVAALDDEPAVAIPGPPSASPSQLPSQPLPLIGRDDVLAAVSSLVVSERLVTLTGPGGIGKTRVAIAAAARVQDHGPHGVVWIDAATIVDATQLPAAIALALGLKFNVPPTAEQVAASLAARTMLLVIDNAEHVIDGAAQVVQALRAQAPDVHVLLTSQEALRVKGEHVVRLPPLALPGPGETADERFGAIALFVERARAVDHRFALDASTGPVVAEICRALDALPLAIELAAARVALLGVRGLRDRLDERLRLLSVGQRDAPQRHHTVRAALEWSHGLLSADERAVLRRLGVFIGGYTLPLAERVAADDDDGALDRWAVLEALGGLVDKSLVAVDPGEPPRYRLLETMRLFALEQLAEAGETERCRRAHARAVAAFFAEADEGRWGDEGRWTQREFSDRIRPEIDNARAALAWAMHAEDWPAAVTLAGAAAFPFLSLGLLREILPILHALRPHVDAGPPSAQVNVLWRLGTFGIIQGVTLAELHAIKEEAVARARTGRFRRRLQMTLASLAYGLASSDRIEAAEPVLAELRALDRPDDPVAVRVPPMIVETAIHSRRNDIRQAVVSLERQREILKTDPDETMHLMHCESNLSMFLNAAGRHDESLAICRALLARPDLPRTFVHTPCNAVYALAALGRPEEARAMLDAHRSEIAATPIGVYSAEALAMLCIARGRVAEAVRIDAALTHYVSRTGNEVGALSSHMRGHLARALAASPVDPDELQRWRSEGQALTDAAAVAMALG